MQIENEKLYLLLLKLLKTDTCQWVMWIYFIYWNKRQHCKSCLFLLNTFPGTTFIFKKTHEEGSRAVSFASTCIPCIWERWSCLSSWSPSPTSGSHWCQMLLQFLISRNNPSIAPLPWSKSGKISVVSHFSLFHQLPQIHWKSGNTLKRNLSLWDYCIMSVSENNIHSSK